MKLFLVLMALVLGVSCKSRNNSSLKANKVFDEQGQEENLDNIPRNIELYSGNNPDRGKIFISGKIGQPATFYHIKGHKKNKLSVSYFFDGKKTDYPIVFRIHYGANEVNGETDQRMSNIFASIFVKDRSGSILKNIMTPILVGGQKDREVIFLCATEESYCDFNLAWTSSGPKIDIKFKDPQIFDARSYNLAMKFGINIFCFRFAKKGSYSRRKEQTLLSPLYVESVTPNSRADRVGIEGHSIILGINDVSFKYESLSDKYLSELDDEIGSDRVVLKVVKLPQEIPIYDYGRMSELVKQEKNIKEYIMPVHGP